MKKCPRCRELKEDDLFYKGNSYCKPCVKEKSQIWKKRNPELTKSHKKTYRDKPEAKQKATERRHSNPEPYRQSCRDYWKNNKKKLNIKDVEKRTNLSDYYIRKILRRSGLEVTPELIEERRAQILLHREQHTAKESRYFCKECENVILHAIGDKIKVFCSTTCRNRHNQRIRNQRRRAEMRKVYLERVDPTKVFEEHGYICQICGIKTPIHKRGSFDDDAPELDHIIPISKGGLHSYINVQCSCRLCNQVKGANA